MADIPQVGPDDVGGEVWLLDVREDDEWAAGHAPNAIHIKMSEVPARLAEVPTDRRVVAVCRGGARSQRVAELLAPQGVDVANLAGGMNAWAVAGREVVTDDGQPGLVI